MNLEASWGLELGAAGGFAFGGEDASSSDAARAGQDLGGGGGGVDYNSFSTGEAREQLLSYLIYLKESGSKVTAKAVCELCWWIGKSFDEPLSGPLRDVAKQPGAQSGKYSLHFDQVVYGSRPTDQSWYYVDTPVFLRCNGERVVRSIASLPPHEASSDCIHKHGGDIIPRFVSARDSLSLPQCYYTHPCVVQSPGELVFMYAIYLDAVDFTRLDSEVGFWLVDLFTGERWCLVVLRTSELCNCGCKGNCTFHPFWCMFLWSFRALKRGVSPVQRHDNTKFADADPRLASAGHKLHSKGACLVLKSDWMEWVKMGFRSWSHSTHPCAICLCDATNMQQCDTVSRSSFPFGLQGFGDDDAYCRECEIYIVGLSDANY